MQGAHHVGFPSTNRIRIRLPNQGLRRQVENEIWLSIQYRALQFSPIAHIDAQIINSV